MIYYCKASSKCKVIGRMYPQSLTMSANYGYRNQANAVSKVSLPEKLDFIPNLDAFELHNYAKRTDYISAISLLSLTNWLISPAFKEVLGGLRLPECQFFDAWVTKGAKRYPYYVVHFYERQMDVIDYSRSTFYRRCLSGNKGAFQKEEIASAADYERLHQQKERGHFICAERLYFVPETQINVDVLWFHLIFNGIFVTERFKQAIEAAGLTGMAFKPVGECLKRNLKWASTGLPVEP